MSCPSIGRSSHQVWLFFFFPLPSDPVEYASKMLFLRTFSSFFFVISGCGVGVKLTSASSCPRRENSTRSYSHPKSDASLGLDVPCHGNLSQLRIWPCSFCHQTTPSITFVLLNYRLVEYLNSEDLIHCCKQMHAMHFIWLAASAMRFML